MKLVLDFYKEELDVKKIGEEYEEILEKIVKSEDDDYSKMLDENSKIYNIFALSEIRENILNWYEFKDNSSILELNANYGEITGLLCNKANKVVSIESSKKCAELIKQRYSKKENLELYAGRFENINLNEKFDYIIIIDIVENLEKAIEYAKEHLKEDGIILLAVNNKFGIKSWSTSIEEFKITHNSNNAISREKLNKLLEGLNYRYYYPLPDFKLPNIIYTENYLPEVFNLHRDITYKEGRVNFKEVDAYREIINNNSKDFEKFANSFLIEISRNTIEENQIRFVSFSNMRKDEYRIKTIVKEKEVYKTAVNSKADGHIENVKKNIDILNNQNINILDTYNEKEIISKYTDSDTFENQLEKIYLKDGKLAFIEKIKEYEDFLKNKLEVIDNIENNIFTKYQIDVEKEKLEKMTFIKHGLWDLIFQNCFIIEGDYYFYDQEWYEENIPVEYIIYRAIRYSNITKKCMTDDEIFDNLGIKDFTGDFLKIDDKLQEKTRKQLMWNIHSKDDLIKDKYNKIELERDELKSKLEQKEHEVEVLINEKLQRDGIIEYMENSFSWKITKPIRKIRKML